MLKIAKPFVDEMGGAGEQARLLGAIISLGETLQMLTVAEGVEFEYQAEGLRMLGSIWRRGSIFPVRSPRVHSANICGAA